MRECSAVMKYYKNNNNNNVYEVTKNIKSKHLSYSTYMLKAKIRGN